MVEKLMKIYTSLCKKLSKFKIDKDTPKPSEELKTSLEFLGWDIKPDEVATAAKSITILSAIFFMILSTIGFLLGANVLFLIMLTVGLPILLNHAIGEFPKIMAREKAMEALGVSPQLIAQLSISLKQNPNLEKAMEFVAQHGEGEIAEDFKRSLRDLWNGKISNSFTALEMIAEKWGKWSEGFQRSLYTIISSFYEKNKEKKIQTLDRAVQIILDDTISNMNEYASSLHIPTLALFSFGVIMPLILVSLFPLVSFIGLSFGIESVVIFLLLSLIGVFFYSNATLKKRPPSFSLIDIKSTLPSGYIDIFGFILPAIPFVIATGLFISIPSIIYLIGKSGIAVLQSPLSDVAEFFNTFPLIWAIGAMISAYFWGTYKHKKIERDKIKKLESSIIDLLYSIRDGLEEGKPLEDSLDFAVKMQPKSQLASQVKQASNLIKRRHISAEDALSGPESPFDKRSKLINSILSLITVSSKKGIQATSQTCEVTIKYLTRLREVEKSMLDTLSKSLSMMKLTAVFFAPVVSAIIVVLFYMLIKGVISTGATQGAFGEIPGLPSSLSSPKIPAPLLQLILGIYTICLNIVLIRYITIVNYGYDKIQIGMEISKTTLAVVVIFTITLLIMKSAMGA